MWRRYDAFMSRLYGSLSSLSASIVSGIFGVSIGVLGNYIYDELSEPNGSSLKISFGDLLSLSSLSVILLSLVLTYLLLGVLRLFAQRANRRHRVRGSFDVLKPATKLVPEDLGFQVLEPKAKPDPHKRPFYKNSYIPRRIVRYERHGEKNPQPQYDERALAQHLQEGKNFVLIADPLSGKGHTLYEVVRLMEGYMIIRPKPEKDIPSEEDLALLFKNKRLVLLLEDLTDYLDARADLHELSLRLQTCRASWVAACACRAGPQLETVRESADRDLQTFYNDDINLKLHLLALSGEEKEQLARSIGKDWTIEESELYPTPGWITMEEPKREMRRRYEDELSPQQKDTVRTLKLLSSAGVLPFTHRRLKTIVSHENLFERHYIHLRDCLERLADYAFIHRPAPQDPVQPEPAYLEDGVATYIEGRAPEDDFGALAEVLKDLKDYIGLMYLGITLKNLGRYEEAIKTCNAALQIRPDYPDALIAKGVALKNLGRYEEAMKLYDKVLDTRPDHPIALNNKGVALAHLGHHKEAIEAHDAALQVRPDNPGTLSNKGNALNNMSCYEEAIEAYDAALKINPTLPEALHGKGEALRNLRRYEEAIDVYDKALELRPDYCEVLLNRGNALHSQGRYEEAIAGCDAALEINPNYAEALNNKGNALSQLGHYGEAVQFYDAALKTSPDFPEVLVNKGIVLLHLGRKVEAIELLCRAWRQRERLPDKGNQAANIIRTLGIDPEECA